MTSAAVPQTAFGLYRALLRYSQTLTLTDPAYFRRRIRSEFLQSKNLTDPQQIQRRLRQAQALLERKTVV